MSARRASAVLTEDGTTVSNRFAICADRCCPCARPRKVAFRVRRACRGRSRIAPRPHRSFVTWRHCVRPVRCSGCEAPGGARTRRRPGHRFAGMGSAVQSDALALATWLAKRRPVDVRRWPRVPFAQSVLECRLSRQTRAGSRALIPSDSGRTRGRRLDPRGDEGGRCRGPGGQDELLHGAVDRGTEPRDWLPRPPAAAREITHTGIVAGARPGSPRPGSRPLRPDDRGWGAEDIVTPVAVATCRPRGTHRRSAP